MPTPIINNSYKLINGSLADSSSDLLFSVTSDDDSQSPILELFTKNKELITHLQSHGYVTGNSLLAQVISLIGRRKAKELLIQHKIELHLKLLAEQICTEQCDKKIVALQKEQETIKTRRSNFFKKK